MTAPTKKVHVELGLSGGTEISGWLAEAFSPYQPTLSIDDSGRTRRVRATDVAYVGIMRDEGHAPSSALPSE
jgi:hypothetical protein